MLILSGALIFYSGNLDLGNLQVHLGLPGFQSYVIPLVLVLCGALVWFTPAQRIFYGVIGLLAAVYSLVGANLGGFIIGFLFGIFGGGSGGRLGAAKRSRRGRLAARLRTTTRCTKTYRSRRASTSSSRDERR